MKCFYHVDRDAVGTCQYCGKSLCRECASQYSPLSCEDCHRKMVAKSINEREQRKQKAIGISTKELIKILVVGAIFAAIFSYIGLFNNEYEPVKGIISGIVFGFGFPFGWRALKFIPFFYSLSADNLYIAFLLNFFKVILAIIIGVPAAVIQLFITIRNLVIAKRM